MTIRIYVPNHVNLAALIDNVYGLLSSSQATALLGAIDDNEEDPRRGAVAYLLTQGITIQSWTAVDLSSLRYGSSDTHETLPYA